MPQDAWAPPTEAEARKIRAVVKRQKLPPGVDGFELSFGQDWTGDPAVWVLFKAQDDNDPSDEKMRAIAALTRSVTQGILALGLRHWPFVRFVVDEEVAATGSHR